LLAESSIVTLNVEKKWVGVVFDDCWWYELYFVHTMCLWIIQVIELVPAFLHLTSIQHNTCSAEAKMSGTIPSLPYACIACTGYSLPSLLLLVMPLVNSVLKIKYYHDE
jgi:hypothetical protein